MKGIELCEQFYKQYGAPMLRGSFENIEHLLAVGIVGSGSECFGYDDEISQDHDFEPGFCIFLPSEDVIDRKTEFALERAYAKLPKEFMGYKRSPLSPVGGNRHGVMRTSEFFKSKTGTSDGRIAIRDWFYLPEQSIAEATNGKIFFDGLGEVTSIRERLSYMPEDVRLKKLAGHILTMGQTGQYNYSRCVCRGECAAAQLALSEFVKSALSVTFLLNKRYIPYYKWSFHALRELPTLSNLYEPLEYLLSSGNGESEVQKKKQTVESICESIIEELCCQALSEQNGTAIEAYAYAVNNKINDGEIRNLHILYAV
jgi:hypothetical protein